MCAPRTVFYKNQNGWFGFKKKVQWAFTNCTVKCTNLNVLQVLKEYL